MHYALVLLLQVELYSRKSSLGAKLEQKAVALHLLPAERDGPITRHIKRALNLFLNARRNRQVAEPSAADELGVPGRVLRPCKLPSRKCVCGRAGPHQLFTHPCSPPAGSSPRRATC